MNKTIAVLAALLLVQLAFAGSLLVKKERYEPFAPDEKLFTFDAAAVDGISVVDGEGNRFELKKEKGAWSIPALDGFPASHESVDSLLEKLAGLEKGWPVATSPGAAARFKTDESGFERKIVLSAGADEKTLYVGTSPGMRKVHARVPGEDSVYAVELNTYELATDGEDWIDRKVLELNAGDIARIELPDVTLLRRDGEIVPETMAEGEEADDEKIDGFVNALAGLAIRSVLGREKKPEYNQDSPELDFTVTLTSGEAYDYTLSAPEKGNHLVLKTTRREEFLSVDSWAVDRIRDASRKAFIKAGTPSGESGKSGGSS